MRRKLPILILALIILLQAFVPAVYAASKIEAISSNVSLCPFDTTSEGAGKVDILSSKTLTNQTGKVNNYESATKGFDAAKADFDALKPSNVRTYPNGTTVGELPNGTTVNVRPSSSGGYPTVEIYDPATGTSTKIRY